MSLAASPSTVRPYTLSRVCRAWNLAQSGVYHALSKKEQQDSPKKRPDPQGFFSDDKLQEHIRDVIEDIEDLNQALQDFKEPYNSDWLIARYNYQTPIQVRVEKTLALEKVG